MASLGFNDKVSNEPRGRKAEAVLAETLPLLPDSDFAAASEQLSVFGL